MTANSSLAYPAEYYYPEFIDNRPDDPRKSSPTNLPLTTSIDNGIGSSTKTPTDVTIIKKKSLIKKQPSKNLALDVVIDQGLPDMDITQAVKTDPKKNLLRDPVEKNIPRLIVDDSIIQQSVRTPRIITTNLDNGFEQRTNFNQINHGITPFSNGNINGDLINKTKFQNSTRQKKIKFAEDEQPIDDYWKKEVHIDDEGVVTIEPLKYDKNTYDGPFGLTRRGSFIYYITVGIFTILGGIFLIWTGVYYSQNYPSSSSSTATLSGIGICALVFYLGLQLIFIALWHQKYRQENSKNIIKKSNKRNNSAAHLKSSMENNEQYDYSYQQPIDYSYQQPIDYSYQQPIDYTQYENYANPPYVSNVNEQMLLQQPGVATGAAYYEPVVWPSNVEVETQPDSKFFQPMEWAYGPQPITETPSTATALTAPSTGTNNNKIEKKSHRHHHNKKTVEANPPKPQFDNIIPNSTVIEAPLPILKKAPETNELIKSMAEMEKNYQPNSAIKNSNRIKPIDNGTDISSVDEHHHRHRRHSRHHHHQRRRHHSYSSCSTCSNRSHDDFYSDVGYNHYHHKHHHSEPVQKIITPQSSRTRSPSPLKRHRTGYRDTGTGTELETKMTRNSSVKADLEDVPNVRDNRLEQIPVVRRTVIVEPYPAEPSSQIILKPQSGTTEKIHSGENPKLNENNERFIDTLAIIMSTKSKKKKKKKPTETNNNNIEDLKLEDVNDVHDDNENENENENENTKSKKKSTNKTLSKKNPKNAFYD